MVGLETRSGVPNGAKLKFVFAYDDQGRRVSKVVSNWTGSAWAFMSERRFVRDGWPASRSSQSAGWNLVAELDGNLAVVRTYLWGTDLSGSMQGAGGVGGLLFISDPSNGVHAVAYDGNGNICGLVNMADGATSARYEYDPFGRTTRATGLGIASQPYRFSTKYHDESGLVDYGHRFYNPSLGRWPNRDPITEWGNELNLFEFLLNTPTTAIDALGLATYIYVGFGYDRSIAEADLTTIVGPFVEALRSTLEKCQSNCCDFESGRPIQVIESYDWDQKPAPIARNVDGLPMWDLTNEATRNQARSLTLSFGEVSVQHEVIPVVMTSYEIFAIDLDTGMRNAAQGVTSGFKAFVRSSSNPLTLAHEIGHLAGYWDPKTKTRHSTEVDNLMSKTGGTEPDCTWCSLVYSQFVENVKNP